MSDFYGYNRQVQSVNLPSADNVVIDIGQGRIGLVQGFQASYAHEVAPAFEFGSSNLFWRNARPMGQFMVSKLVSKDGLFSAFRTGGDACGGLRQITISLAGGSCEVTAGTGMNFSGAKLQSVQVSGQAGGFDLTESATFLVAEMR